MASIIPDGALQCLLSSESIDAPTINQDREDEVESLMAGIRIEDSCNTQAQTAIVYHLRSEQPANKKQKLQVDTETVKRNLKTASENVVVDNTLQEYRRYVTLCLELWIANLR